MTAARIDVAQTGRSDPLEFAVSVTDARGETRHHVTLARREAERLCPGCDPAACVEAAVRFLLDREPKEAILRRFDLAVISRYFPEFETVLPRYLAGGPAAEGG